jgi:hypothetical protein
MPEPKTKHFMRLLVQLTEGTAWALYDYPMREVDDPAAGRT